MSRNENNNGDGTAFEACWPYLGGRAKFCAMNWVVVRQRSHIDLQWRAEQDVLEQAKLDAMAAGAPAPGASLPDNMAPMTAPSGNPAPEDIKNSHKIKLASAHEGTTP
jgi:hypothetical protein